MDAEKRAELRAAAKAYDGAPLEGTMDEWGRYLAAVTPSDVLALLDALDAAEALAASRLRECEQYAAQIKDVFGHDHLDGRIKAEKRATAAEARVAELLAMGHRIWAAAIAASCDAAVVADKAYGDEYVERWITTRLESLRAAEARVAELEADRDKWREQRDRAEAAYADMERRRDEALESREQWRQVAEEAQAKSAIDERQSNAMAEDVATYAEALDRLRKVANDAEEGEYAAYAQKATLEKEVARLASMTDARDALRTPCLDRMLEGEWLIHRPDCPVDNRGLDCPCGLDAVRRNARQELDIARAALAEMDAPAEARCWTEDYEEENGQYAHRCRSCQGQFLGHKHRENLCKLCAPRGKCGTCGGSGRVTDAYAGRYGCAEDAAEPPIADTKPCPECAGEERDDD